MSTGIKKEQGAEAAPVLAENTEVASNTTELLENKVTDLEATIAEKDNKIIELEAEKEKLTKEVKALKAKQPKQVKAKEDETLIRFTLSPAGKFKLPYNVGQEVAMDKEVAAEIVEAKYAEYVK